MTPQRVIVAITGASGVVYGIRALEVLRDEHPEIETHLIISAGGRMTIAYETEQSTDDVRALADVVHADGNLGSPISSGSFRVSGMLVAPCSIKTLSAIANSYDDNLVARAADVVLKEGRRLVLMVRETPLHQGHLSLMHRAAQNGAVIMPPVPAFYHLPKTIDDLVDQTVGRALDQLGVETSLVDRWSGPQRESPA